MCLCYMFVFQALSTLDSVSLMYPFFYRPLFEVIEDGWQLFLQEETFKDLESMVLFYPQKPCRWGQRSNVVIIFLSV